MTARRQPRKPRKKPVKKPVKPATQYEVPAGPEVEPRPDKALRAAICKWVRDGVVVKQAALVEGVFEDEFTEWMRSDSSSCAQFRRDVARAEATSEALVVGRIKASAKTDWKAAAWLAERNWPERYQRKSIQGDDAPRNPSKEPGPDDPFAALDNVVDMKDRRGTR